MQYSIQHIAKLSDAVVSGLTENSKIDHILYDSRKITSPKNGLFICVSGKHHDGHKYIADAYHEGVRNFIVEKNIDSALWPDATFLNVNNAIEALQKIATAHRIGFHIPVIGITGSNGKTIVKEWINQLLSPNFVICRSPRSFNSQLGVPLSILELEQYHNLAIIEAGISEPKEMEKLAQVIRPTIGIFTMIGEAHQQNFTSLEEKITEKIKLFEGAETIIFPADDNPFVKKQIDLLSPQNIVTWGKNNDANLQILNEFISHSHSIIHVKWKNSEKKIEIPFTDQASIHNALCALTTALFLNDNLDALAERIAFLSPVNMRLQLISGALNTTLINDAYSSDLTSLDVALDFQNQHSEGKTKSLVLSDMAQTGVPKNILYKKINELIANHRVQKFIGVGKEISSCKSMFSDNAVFFEKTEDFIKKIKPNDHSGEIILIKGAREFEFEKIIQLLQEQTHETVLEIHLDALAHNFHFYKNKLRDGVKMMVMVKASGYGAGAVEVAKVLEFHKADYLGVAYVDEGVMLRRAGISIPIMVMNVELNAFNHLINFGLEPELYSLRSINAFIDVLKRQKRDQPYPIHIKIDTGMKRLGFEKKDLNELISILKATPEVRVKSIFTHLAATDNPSHDAFTNTQLLDFENAANALESAIGYTCIKHAANTSGIERFPNAQFDMVRLGIGIYGMSNSAAEIPHLQHVGVLKTTISQIKQLAPNESVGYNRNYISSEHLTIATIPLGYADGLRRSLSNGNWSVLINGCACPIVGNVCMDMTMVNVTNVPCAEGDEAIIFHNAESLQAFASACNTIPYEVLTSIPARVKRIYSGEV